MSIEQNQPAEQQAIEVFTAEQLAILPQEAQDSIIYLEKRLPANELKILNPLVAELIKIKNLELIQYVPDDKKSIEEYKAAKKQIVAVKKMAAEAKKQIKGPLDEMGKEVVGIEKGIKSIAESVQAVLETTFKPYEDAEEQKRKLAQEKKDKKLTDKIQELTSEQQAQKDHNEKIIMLNMFKHEKSANIEKKVNEAIPAFSQQALENLLVEVEQYNITTIYTGFRAEAKYLIEKQVLTDDEYIAAVGVYQEKITSLIQRIKDKIEMWKLQSDNTQMKTTQDVITNFGNFPIAQTQPVDNQIDFDKAVEQEGDIVASGTEVNQPEYVGHQETINVEDKVLTSNTVSAPVPTNSFADQVFEFLNTNSVEAINFYGDNGTSESVPDAVWALRMKLGVLKNQYGAIYAHFNTMPNIEAQRGDMRVLSASLQLMEKIETYIQSIYLPNQQ